MSRPHFNLRNKNAPKESPIFLYYNYDHDKPRLKYSIKRTCLPKFWDQKSHRVKVSLNYLKHLSLNKRLNEIEHEAVSIVKKFDDLSHEKFKLELDYFLKFKRRPGPCKPPTFFEFLDQWIKILEKCDYSLPKISDQRMNDYIVEVGREVELTDWYWSGIVKRTVCQNQNQFMRY